MKDLRNTTQNGYSFQEIIGDGGFGTVYRAQQIEIGHEVAVKVIPQHYSNHPSYIRSFDNEAQIVAKLENIRIVPLYNFWRNPSGSFLVMRLMHDSLARALTRKALTKNQSLVIIQHIAAALSYAHHHNVIHCDIKPANILLDNEHNAYLADFGIARQIDTATAAQHHDTYTAYTPAYAAPEQRSGQPPTKASDIYSLAAIAYQLITGHTAAHHQDYLTHDLPHDLHHIFQKALANTPERRYESPTAFAQALTQIWQPPLDIALGQPYPAPLPFDSAADHTAVVSIIQPENPYRGLLAFRESDAAMFFGRQHFTQQLIEHLDNQQQPARFLAIVGPSGSGKSSVVHAGLIPHIRQGHLPSAEDWFITGGSRNTRKNLQ